MTSRELVTHIEAKYHEAKAKAAQGGYWAGMAAKLEGALATARYIEWEGLGAPDVKVCAKIQAMYTDALT